MLAYSLFADWLCGELEIMKFGSQHTYIQSESVLLPPAVTTAVTQPGTHSAQAVLTSWQSEQPVAAKILRAALESNVRLFVLVGDGINCALTASNKLTAMQLLGCAPPAEAAAKDDDDSTEKADDDSESDTSEPAPPEEPVVIEFVYVKPGRGYLVIAEESRVRVEPLAL